MKSRIVAALVVVTMLVAFSAIPAAAVEDSVDADVVVTEYVSFSVTDSGNDGVQFGSLNPGTTDSPDLAQNGTGAVTLTVGNETNVAVGIYLKGDDFLAGAYSLAVSNVKYDDDATVGGTDTGLAEGTMPTTYGSAWTTVPAGGGTIQVYHWISVPSNQEAGSYHSTFYYKAE